MTANQPRSNLLRISLRVLLIVVLPAVIIVASVGAARMMMETAPRAERKPRPRSARLVDVVRADPTTHKVRIEAMGTTMPAIQVDLKPQVAGRVDGIDAALVPGGTVHAGDPIVQIERTDFEIALAQRKSEQLEAEAQVTTVQSNLITAEKDLRVEEGNQQVAQREFDLLGQEIPEAERGLVLRVPQLLAAEASVKSAEAAVASAEAALESARLRVRDAELDLERATVKAPCNAVVMKRTVDIGDIVSTNSTLTALVGTDRVWVETAVPVSQLRWLEIPRRPGESGSTVRIENPDAWGSGAYRTGTIVGLAPELDTQGRMARVVVAVDDPFVLDDGRPGRPPMLMGSYVRVTFEGPELDDVIRLPRALLRDGDTIWLMLEDGVLDVRPVEIVHRGRDEVLVSAGVVAGDRIVTTDLSTAIAGLPLQLRDHGRATEGDEAYVQRDEDAAGKTQGVTP